jgi:ribosomal protein S18 acetylase RimI-like enzyme
VQHPQEGNKLADDLISKARDNVGEVDASVAESGRKAAALYERTRGTGFENFGKQRGSVANKRAQNPEYPGLSKEIEKMADSSAGVIALKAAVIALVGLTAYGLSKVFSDSDDES